MCDPISVHGCELWFVCDCVSSVCVSMCDCVTVGVRVCASVGIHTSVVAQTRIACAVREPLPWHEGPCLRLMHLLGAQVPLRALTSGDMGCTGCCSSPGSAALSLPRATEVDRAGQREAWSCQRGGRGELPSTLTVSKARGRAVT